jgi:hypothetical protein
VGVIVPFKQLRQLRLERLKTALLSEAAKITRNPLHAGGRHPGYVKLGRILYEAATRDYRPAAVPKPLRRCPWIFVMAELAREYPDIRWGETSLAEYVQLYLYTLAEPKLPVSETLPLDFERAKHIEEA